MQLCPLCGINCIFRRELFRKFRLPAAKVIACPVRLCRLCYRRSIFSLSGYRIRLAVNIAPVEFERKRDFFSCVLNFNNGRAVAFYRFLVNSRCYKSCIVFAVASVSLPVVPVKVCTSASTSIYFPSSPSCRCFTVYFMSPDGLKNTFTSVFAVILRL